jgi:hypothetical protein
MNCPKDHFIFKNQIVILDKNAQKGQKRNIYVRKWRNDVKNLWNLLFYELKPW